ncbi:MAG: T9SS type A sorting domain-containing protein, partial [Candidatus Kapabacteria bacterium]|nr:T9SS type A sorting domain-containing protein [Candidatus Kapabacteria bacterium]
TGSSVTLTAEDGFNTYLWSNGSTGREINVTETGSYFVTVLDKATQCPVSSAVVKIDVNDPPVKPIVTRVGDVLSATSSSDVEAWAWNYNGARIQNVVSSSYTVTRPGTYSATAIRKGCESTSENFEIVFTGVNDDVVAGAANFTVFPNPTNGRVSISTGLALSGNVRINITNAVGVSVMSVNEVASGAGFTSSFDMTSLPAGLYNVVITNGSERWVVSLIRQ